MTKPDKVVRGLWPVAGAGRLPPAPRTWRPMTDHGSLAARHVPLCLCLLLLLPLATGCRVVQTAADVPSQTLRAVSPGKKGPPPADPVEIQQTLLRFADEFLIRMISGADKLRHATNAPDAAEILQTKIDLGSATYAIASAPNPIANLLDMTIFVTVTRMSLEEHWMPKVYGASARPMLDSSRNAETDIWQLVGTVLTPAQQAELRRTIETWRRQNPQPESIVAARAVGFASQIAQSGQGDKSPSDSLRRLLLLDPLSGFDPAVREVAQTRLFAERALFVSQKMPMLLRWQIELLSVNAARLPPVQQLVTNSTQIAASVDRFARVAEQLPGRLSTEREEILKALESQEKNLTPLVNQVRESLAAGTAMSTSLNTTLITLDALMKRLGVGDTNQVAGPPPTNAEPFRIQDYAATAAQLETTARQLTELLLTLDRTIGSTNLAQLSAQVAPAVQQAQAGAREIVDYAFRKGLLLMAVVLVAAFLYRLLAARLMPARRAQPHSP